MFRNLGIMGGVLLTMAGPLGAEPIDSKAAKKLLFSPKGAEVRMIDGHGLSESEVATLKVVLANIAYFGAAAIAPDEGLQSEATQAVTHYHSSKAARAAALGACDAARKGGAKCKIVADIVPRKYQPRDLELSQAATENVRKAYRKLKGEKAFAISPSTGGWAFVAEENAEVAVVGRCNSSAGVSDCKAVIADK